MPINKVKKIKNENKYVKKIKYVHIKYRPNHYITTKSEKKI